MSRFERVWHNFLRMMIVLADMNDRSTGSEQLSCGDGDRLKLLYNVNGLQCFHFLIGDQKGERKKEKNKNKIK